MKPLCPDSKCLSSSHGPDFGFIVRRGIYFRKSDGQRVRRYFCKKCQKSFSSSSKNPCYRQKKRKLNYRIKLLLNSGVSQRRCAWILGVNPKTVVRKFRFLAKEARRENEAWKNAFYTMPITNLEFDDLETSEHSKCKPLSVAMAVESQSRKILGFSVSRMPAKGHLANFARKKYGFRNDERVKGWSELFQSLKPFVDAKAEFRSDQNPQYEHILKAHFPHCRNRKVKGSRGCVTGQGELKKIKFDPIFSLNHTCAMLRANLNRLFRKTWCTTKTIQGLIDHLSLYVNYHNQILTLRTQ